MAGTGSDVLARAGEEVECGLLSQAGKLWVGMLWACQGARAASLWGSQSCAMFWAPLSKVSVGWMGEAATSLLDIEGLKRVLWFQASLQGQGEAVGNIFCEGNGAPSFKHLCSPDPRCRYQRFQPLLCSAMCLCVLLSSITVPWQSNAATLRDSGAPARRRRQLYFSLLLRRLKIFLLTWLSPFLRQEVRRKSWQSITVVPQVCFYTHTLRPDTWEHTLTHTYTEVCIPCTHTCFVRR